jgi:hypothetical protein
MALVSVNTFFMSWPSSTHSLTLARVRHMEVASSMLGARRRRRGRAWWLPRWPVLVADVRNHAGRTSPVAWPPADLVSSHYSPLCLPRPVNNAACSRLPMAPVPGSTTSRHYIVGLLWRLSTSGRGVCVPYLRPKSSAASPCRTAGRRLPGACPCSSPPRQRASRRAGT